MGVHHWIGSACTGSRWIRVSPYPSILSSHRYHRDCHGTPWQVPQELSTRVLPLASSTSSIGTTFRSRRGSHLPELSDVWHLSCRVPSVRSGSMSLLSPPYMDSRWSAVSSTQTADLQSVLQDLSATVLTRLRYTVALDPVCETAVYSHVSTWIHE